MFTTANNKPIPVGILEISSQNKAILEYFFSSTGKKSFKEVSLDKASAFIIDYDSLGAKDSWEATYQETQKPGIIISIKEVDLPSCIWLPKPLTVKALTDAGVSIREMMSQMEVDTEKLFAAPVKSAPVEKSVEKEVKAIKEEAKEVEAQEIFEFDEILTDSVESVEEAQPALEASLEINDLSKQQEPVEVAKTPELAVAEVETTTASTSTPNFAVSPDLLDLDIKVDTPEPVILDTIEEKAPVSETEQVTPQTTEDNSDEGEIDSLLESLITGGKNNEKVDDLLTDFPSENASDSNIVVNKEKPSNDKKEALTLLEESPAKIELETVETKEVTTSDKIDIIDFELEAPAEKLELATPIITDDGSSIALQEQEDDIDIAIDSEEESSFSAIKADVSINENPDIKEDIAIDLLSVDKKADTAPKKSAEDELQSLLEEIRQEASDNSPQSPASSGYKNTPAEERWMLTCGNNDDTEQLEKLCTLTPSNHMITTLLETIEKANWSKKVLRIKFKNAKIIVEPTSGRIYCEQSIFSDIYANSCYEPLNKEDIQIHELDNSEIRLYRKKMQTDKEHTHSFEAFIWTTSLLTSRGRLPVTTNVNSIIGLKYWPNLTRVENTPHMMQIAAIFHKQKSSLSKIPQELGIPQKYVVAFYNAALSLDIIKNTTDNESPSIDSDEGTNKNRGFFSRLLKRISS